MSKHHTRNLRSIHTLFAAFIACGSLVFFADASLAALATQDGGFSIFESAEESVEEVAEAAAPIVVSPKEAFTNPAAKLPKAQFGSFKAASASENAPKLNGSQAVGTYANDGRSMFKAPPNPNDTSSRKLQPFASNSLRQNNRPQPDESTSQTPPIVVGDFKNTARRLSAAPQASNASTFTKPKIGQVTFQDGGGFNPSNRPQEKTAGSRFGQPSSNRFNQQATSAPSTNRFGSGQTRPQQTPQTQPQPLSPRTNQSLRSQAVQPSSRFPQRSMNSQGPAARMAARPQSPGQGLRQRQGQTQSLRGQAQSRGQAQNLGQRQGTGMAQDQRLGNVQQQKQRLDSTTNSTDIKAGSKAAKELLATWVEQDDSQPQLPGKKMTLKSFLAQPINGSRKEAINQYWVTFNDMANHKIAVEQSQWLGSIGNVRQPADQAVLTAAKQAAANRVLHTEIQLAKSQSLLHEFLPNFRYKNGKNIPVLPADIPWVGKLNTNYKEYQSRGMVPQKFNGIDEILPKLRQLIANRADAVAAASEAAEQARNAMASGNSPVANVLEAARIKSKNQQEFLATVTGYNRAITDYVLTVRQDIYQPERLASVLIGRKAVQQSIAKKQKPQEDLDSFDSADSNPTMRQASTDRGLQGSSERGLQGKSAYQSSQIREQATSNERSRGNSLLNQGEEQASTDSSPFSQASSSGQSTAAPKRFDYGPTARSAKAANFNPSEVQEELPMQKAQQASSSASYNGNGSRSATNVQNRSASNTMRQPPRRDPGSFGGQTGAPQGSRPVENRASTFKESPTPPTGRFGNNAGTGGTKPTQNPFTQKSAGPATTPGSRAKSAFGIGGTIGSGTFGGGAAAAPQIPATAGSRFGNGSTPQ